jgi:hypothetical protein
MKFLRTTLFILALGLMAFSSASAQQAVPPPPKPADSKAAITPKAAGSGPSLDETLKFIEGKLNNLGTTGFVNSGTTTTDQTVFSHRIVFELSGVHINPATCVLGYHYRMTVDDGKPGEVDITHGLRESVNIEVLPYEQFATKDWASQGHPEWVATGSQPQTLVLKINSKDKADFWVGWDAFYFQDADLADRVAKAMTHAIELCGGGNKDPF